MLINNVNMYQYQGDYIVNDVVYKFMKLKTRDHFDSLYKFKISTIR